MQGYMPPAYWGPIAELKKNLPIPVIANGGFQDRDVIDRALAAKKCDMVAIARPLLANPDLIELYRRGVSVPARPCSHCNRCSIATAVRVSCRRRAGGLSSSCRATASSRPAT